MSLYLWKPTEEKHKNGFRKHYRDGAKVQHAFPYWLEVFAVEHDPSPDNFIAVLSQTWEENWNIALSQFAPPIELEPLKEITCNKGKPLVSSVNEWRRHGRVLEDAYMDFVVLDFDGSHPDVTHTSDLTSRLEAIKRMFPLLNGLEAVAFFSSSAFFRDENKPNRINTHVVVWFDRPYPRTLVRAFLKKYERTDDGGSLLDPALSVKTQPHIVANPIFENTDRIDPKGERLLHVSGSRLCLDDFDLQTEAPKRSVDKGKNADIKLSANSEEKAKQLLRMAEAGELDSRRHDLLFREIYRENFYKDGDTAAFLEAIGHPCIVGDHNIYDMDDCAKFYLYKKLTGREYSGSPKNQKTISHLDLAEYDISSLPLENAVITVKSGCGSGKTKGFIKRMVERAGHNRCLYVSQLKATIEPAARDIGFAYYLEKGEEAKESWCRSQNRLAITDKSLNVLFDNNGVYKRYGLTIVDEVERAAMNAIEPTSRQRELCQILRDSDLVLLLDADVSEDLTLWYANEIAASTKDSKTSIFLLNNKDWMGEGHHCYKLEEEKDVYGITEKLLAQGKRVYLHVGFSDKTEERRISRIVRCFQDIFPNKKILGTDSRTAPSGLRKDPDKFIDWLIEENGGLDLLICSPWSKIGWDYNGKHHFDATVGSYPWHFMTAPDIAQQMRRPRKTTLHYIWTGRKPVDAENALLELEDTLDNHPDIRKLEKNVPFELAERARRKQLRESANISYHLAEILRERGCKYHIGFSTDIDEGQVEELLTQYGEEEEERLIREAWNDVNKRDRVFSDFFFFDREKGTHTDLNEYQASNRNEALVYEDFRALYRRRLNTEDNDIATIARIWFQTPDQRCLLDKENSRYMAELTGRLLDEVDRLVSKAIGSCDKFIEWADNDFHEEIWLLFDTVDYHPIKECLESAFIRYEEKISWLKKSHKSNNFLDFFVQMANYFDIGVEVVKQTGSKKKAKHSIIREYQRQGLIRGRASAKKIAHVNERIAEVNEIIDNKLREKQPLKPTEELWMPHRSKYCIRIFKHQARNGIVRDEVNRYRRTL